MDHKNKYFIILISFLSLCLMLQAGKANSNKSISISINPLKPFLFGLINLDFEYQISSHISFHIFAEYLLKDIDHPDLVIMSGPRYYISSKNSNVSGFYGGVNLGYVWYKNRSDYKIFDCGIESGYKLIFGNSFFLLPRGLLTYPIGSREVLPGFEVLLGKLLP